MFSLLADLSKVEQLAIILQYVDVNIASVYERFLAYVSAECLTAQGLSSLSISRVAHRRYISRQWIVPPCNRHMEHTRT